MFHINRESAFPNSCWLSDTSIRYQQTNTASLVIVDVSLKEHDRKDYIFIQKKIFYATRRILSKRKALTYKFVGFFLFAFMNDFRCILFDYYYSVPLCIIISLLYSFTSKKTLLSNGMIFNLKEKGALWYPSRGTLFLFQDKKDLILTWCKVQ